jgi:hypothetical protein
LISSSDFDFSPVSDRTAELDSDLGGLRKLLTGSRVTPDTAMESEVVGDFVLIEMAEEISESRARIILLIVWFGCCVIF